MAAKKKMKASSINPTIFPDDITIELFSRLPVKSLMRFKCLSTFFNSLPSESYFMDNHQLSCRRSRLDEIKFFVPECDGFHSIEMRKEGRKVSRCDFDFPYNNLSYKSGLFCFSVEKFESVRIFNPSTREVIVLPRVKQLYNLRNLSECYLSLYYGCSYTLGYEPEENKYKVLMTLCVSRECTRNWVFTLGTDKSWREINRVIYSPHKKKHTLCVCGVIYILNCWSTSLVAFDLKAENFKFIPLWRCSQLWNGNYELIEVNGKLAVWNGTSKLVHLRVLVDPQKEEWQSHIIHCPSNMKNFGTYRICSCCDGEILIFLIRLNESVKSRSCYCYDVRKNTWKYLKTSLFGVKNCVDKGIYTYVERLVPLKKNCNVS
ncbi:hypothetical protein R3W88_006904 [Solanum pinnatisectum]|uniref:F-box domain-containing protein n=1 Tax=Solanum pinnatisectum TaxID=50273 RepID=A0AAV9KG23_9SOLN|nr:hypothetical protein R3W88_006904 [Solanum pinnatisectum]